jgi:flagellar biosynthesis protein
MFFPDWRLFSQELICISEKMRAIALKYDENSDSAPIVVAKGAGESAERIIEIAQKIGIPIYRDESTAGILSMLQLSQSIPVELFEIIAAIYVEILDHAEKTR